jgi:hypothetical protein
MRYALSVDKDGRILSVTYEEFASNGMQIVEKLPDADLSDYLYIDNEFVFSPKLKIGLEPTVRDDMDAMIVDYEYRLTMLELGLV